MLRKLKEKLGVWKFFQHTTYAETYIMATLIHKSLGKLYFINSTKERQNKSQKSRRIINNYLFSFKRKDGEWEEKNRFFFSIWQVASCPWEQDLQKRWFTRSNMGWNWRLKHVFFKTFLHIKCDIFTLVLWAIFKLPLKICILRIVS